MGSFNTRTGRGKGDAATVTPDPNPTPEGQESKSLGRRGRSGFKTQPQDHDPTPEGQEGRSLGQRRRSALKTQPQDPTDAKVAAIEAESAAKIAKQQQGATATLQATINQGTVNTQRSSQERESAPTPEPSIEGAQQATDPRRKYRSGEESRATKGGAGIRLT